MEIYRQLYRISKDLEVFTNKVRRLHRLMKNEDWQEQFDELIRDLTSVVPRPKSEVRRRIQVLLDQHKQELLERLTLKPVDDDPRFIASPDEIWGYNQAIKDLEQLKKSI